jgi:hypothetical protein
MIPELSEEAWASLGILHRADHGGPLAPNGFAIAYAELKERGFAVQVAPYQMKITEAGEVVLRERYFTD